jgi:hypothetical protein
MGEKRSVADTEGPWIDPRVETGLIARCRDHWSTPVSDLSSAMLATFIRQRNGLAVTLPEAKRRVASGFTDDSELYDGELVNAVQGIST